MTNNTDSAFAPGSPALNADALPPFDSVEEAQMAAAAEVSGKLPGKVSQFRLYKDANLLIPIAKTTKTAFVHAAVAAAANDPSLLGWALVERGKRAPQTADQQCRISISTSVAFQENVEALATTFRITNEEIVRLAVEAAVFKKTPREQAKSVASDLIEA